MKMQFWSKTTTGKWPAGLTLAFIVLMAIKNARIRCSHQITISDTRPCTDWSDWFHHGADSRHQIQGQSLFDVAVHSGRTYHHCMDNCRNCFPALMHHYPNIMSSK